MPKKEKISDTFEFSYNEKTYVTKKLNPGRKSKVIKSIVSPMSASQEAADISVQLEFIATASDNTPEVLWAFIKDEDKKEIGTFEKFIDEIESEVCDKFTIWAMSKIKESNDFFVEKNQGKGGAQA